MNQCSVYEKKTKKITSGTKEWADYNVNCIKGCYNDCRYCYAKVMAKRFGRKTEETWKNMEISTEALNRKYKKKPGRIMFPSTHDIIDITPYKEACFEVLTALLECGNEVLITTKPRLTIIKEIIDRYSSYKSQIQFRFTITSTDDSLLEFWEPNAPCFSERLDSLRYAFSKNFKTSVSIEPFIDHNPERLVEIVMPFTTESIWIGKMNYILRRGLSDVEVIFYNSVRKNYETSHLREIYNKLKHHQKIRFKDSIKFQLANETF
jgi:DNA repair photolyase